MIVVSDASPLIALAAVGHLDLIHSLYDTVWIPESVLQEVAQVDSERRGAREIRSADWIVPRRVGDSILIKAVDDFRVNSVSVQIVAADGTVIEKGAAIAANGKMQWAYAATTANAALPGTKIIVTATDNAGNEGVGETLIS